MPYAILSLCVLMFFLSQQAQVKQNGSTPETDAKATIRYSDSENFVKYRDALTAFLLTNPTFNGSVTYAQLQSTGNQFSTDFQTKAGNYISVVGSGSGRMITTYAMLSQGSLNDILKLTEGDASIGIANGNTWSSALPGGSGITVPLPVPVPDGSTLSVIQLGG